VLEPASRHAAKPGLLAPGCQAFAAQGLTEPAEKMTRQIVGCVESDQRVARGGRRSGFAAGVGAGAGGVSRAQQGRRQPGRRSSGGRE
jgi:hypothetical protein